MMASRGRSLPKQFRELMIKANEHYNNAEWEDVAKALEGAKACCEEKGFPDRTRSKQKVYGQFGALQRRYGRYQEAAAVLEKALELDEYDSSETFTQLIAAPQQRASIFDDRNAMERIEKSNNVERLEILGELGTVYRHMDDYDNAGKTFEIQFKLAQRLSWQVDAEVCRAIGNVGMTKYQQAMGITDEHDAKRLGLLTEAIEDSKNRISSAQFLRTRLAPFESDSEALRLGRKAHSWEAIGIVRLVLCYLALDMIPEALEEAKHCMQVCETLQDPTSRAHARFYYGLVLWKTDMAANREQAKKLFEFQGDDKRDRCTPAIAFCKEPSGEFREYLRVLVDTCKTRVDLYDEQGYSALDYATFCNDKASQDIIVRGITQQRLPEGRHRSSEELAELRHEAQMRKHYRVILQEHFRPTLSEGGRDCIGKVKRTYARLLTENAEMRRDLDCLKYVRWLDFKKLRQLPSWDVPKLVKQYQDMTMSGSDEIQLVFMSYRWLGVSDHATYVQPDDQHNTQYLRMCDALDKLIREKGIREDHLGVWLDLACIDQNHKESGIAALPLVISQCKYMISLVDESGEYYTRAWCCSEVLLARELELSYHQHEHLEHVITNPRHSLSAGTLQHIDDRRIDDLVPSEQGLSYEKDRKSIRFLERQSRLLAKDPSHPFRSVGRL